MRRRIILAGASVAAIAAAIVPASAAVRPASSAGSVGSVANAIIKLLPVCGTPIAGHDACNSILAIHRDAGTSTSSGYVPSQLLAAYNLATASASGGTGQTVGIVDAYDDVTAAADLATYRSAYGLPACTTANGCFSKVNETGGTTPPTANASWGQEESLDMDMVSAICPKCHILLVEATSTSDADLGASVNEAAKLGATEISNSYGGSESSGQTAYDADYNHPGIAITASAGDGGYGVEYPAATPTVTAVGGTSLSTASNSRGWTETVWGSSGVLSSDEGTGSGCSAYETKPAWQIDTGCTKRTVADVAAVADPDTGVAVYDSTAYDGSSGWLEFGGTSVASPIIASVYAIAGNAASTTGAKALYAKGASLYDVTSGSNGSCGGLFSGGSTKKYLCTGETGYDGPTGNGTPDGVGAF